MKNVLLELYLLPRNILIALIIGYRKTFSKLYGDVCRYYPSCSAYGLGSLQQHGVIRGIPLTLWRILRCNPWSKGGVDDVRPGPNWFFVSKLGFVHPVTQAKVR